MASRVNTGSGVRFTNVYQDATTIFNETTTAQFDVANPCPAGLVEEVGFRLKGTTASAPSAASMAELITGLRMTFNGDQWLNAQMLAGVNTNTECARLGALVQDLGGRVVEAGSTTAQDMTIWIPCGINIPTNSRFELNIQYAIADVAITVPKFEIWFKYGKSTNATIVGNMTSESIAHSTQTMVSVKIPTYKNATVAGIVIQCPTAEDNLTELIVKPLGDFAYSSTYLRGISGASQNGYQFMDAGDDANANQYNNALVGYYFVPLYNLSVVDGSVVLLLTVAQSGALAAQNYTFTPILNLPTGGSGERTPKQTASVATGSKGAILQRAEDN